MVIDGKYFAYRTRYSKGFSDLEFNDIATGIYYGFFLAIQSLAKHIKPDKTIICWDLGTKSVRRDLFPEYKIKKFTKELSTEEHHLNEVFKTEYLNLVRICGDIGFKGNSVLGFESDDVMAKYCLDHPDEEIYVCTKDEDLYQCISENVIFFDPDKKKKKDLNWFKKEYGIEPENWVDVKKIAGCKSDCVPGIVGIGEKRALQYITNTATDTIKNKIESEPELLKRNYELVKLPHPKFPEKMEYHESKLDMDAFISFCQTYGMKHFLENLHDFEIFE